jgi:hypothetical protein
MFGEVARQMLLGSGSAVRKTGVVLVIILVGASHLETERYVG